MALREHAGVATSLVTPHPGAGATATLAPEPSPDGLTTAGANQRLVQAGPNSLPDTTLHPLLQALKSSGHRSHGCSRPPWCSSWCSATSPKRR
jgi:hypothetical protein